MDLTPLQRKAAFAVIVLALAGLGAFLLVPGSPAAQIRGPHRPAPTRPAPAATSAAPAAATPAGASPSPSAVDIYRWLPFSQSGLAAAAAVVRAFSADYATYSYTQSASGYVGRMNGLITSQLAATLARGYATPGVVQQRNQQKQSATGSGQITALRAFGPSSLTFLVTITQKIRSASSQGTSQRTTGYAVTVTGAGAGWQVSDIEYANAGNS
jgi:hypothetical protein